MKTLTKFSLLFVAILAGIGLGLTILAQEISDISCSIDQPCPEGLDCFDFPEIGLRCAQPDPCSYYECPEGTRCAVGESFPFKLICTPIEEVPSPPEIISADEAIRLDEDIQSEDLGVGDPRLLPDSPFYFLKNWARGIRSFFTFNPVAKANLRERFASEKLLELKKLAEKTENPEILKKAAENYQKETEALKKIAERLEKLKEKPKVKSFLNKFLSHQILHQKFLQRLEKQVPPQAFEKIKKARERHLEHFKDVMLKLEKKEKIPEILEKIIEKQKGSKFKEFKNLEILKDLEEKVPENIKETIQKARERILKKLKERIEKMPSAEKEKFKDYIERISGDKEKQLEILENLRSVIKEKPELQKRFQKIREKVIEKVKERTKKMNCPQWTPPAPGFCQKGRIVIDRDPKTGCPMPPRCIIPAEIEIPKRTEKAKACMEIWAPVCGKDGKTYSNKCFAELAGAEIAYKGKCRAKECQADADCPQPKCGPLGTIRAKCIGIRAACREGKCVLVEIKPAE